MRVHPEYLAGQGIDPARGEDDELLEGAPGGHRRLGAAPRAGRARGSSSSSCTSPARSSGARFLARAEEQEKHWKFSAGDVAERAHWDAYQHAYEQALRATSTPDAPWYVIPADHKWLMRTAVASILVHHLEDLDPKFPEPSAEDQAAMEAAVGS